MICAISIIVYGSVLVANVFKKDDYNLDLNAYQIQTYLYDLSDPANIKPFNQPCLNKKGCTTFTIGELI